MQIIKSSATTPFSHIPRWLKWFLLICCVIFLASIFIRPYVRNADQVKHAYQAALKNKNYKAAYQYLDHHYPGLSYDVFQHWQEHFPETKQIAVHKMPLFFNLAYTWGVDLPTKNVTLQVPFPNLTVMIDGLSYQMSSTLTTMPLIAGTHAVSVKLDDLELGKQTIVVTKNPDKQTIAIMAQPPSNFTATVKNFLTQYNKTWCQAVDLRTPDSILPFLSGRTSSEYQFLIQYIQTVANQNWVSDIETLKDLKITNIQFKDSTHLYVTTEEVYHHVMQIVKDHGIWHQGDKKQYDSSVSWTYTLKFINSKTLQIESLSRPL